MERRPSRLFPRHILFLHSSFIQPASSYRSEYGYLDTSVEKLALLRAEVICYTLPYGGLGFVSHLLTYYTLFMLFSGRQPLRPWKCLTVAWWDTALGIVQLVSAIVLSVIAMVRCRSRWEFVLIACWMLTTSLALSVASLTGPLPGLRWKREYGGWLEEEFGWRWLRGLEAFMVRGMGVTPSSNIFLWCVVV